MKFFNNSHKVYKKGFTLIELLVVVAIIGILASVVVASLNNARSKGGDAAIKTNLATIRAASELFSSANGNSFLPSGGSTFAIATCPSYNASGTNMLAKDVTINAAILEAISRGGNGSSCYNSASICSVAVGLKTSASASWCVDSAGISRQVASAPASAINTSTFLCN